MINFNLLRGKLNYTDMELILNPEAITAEYVSDRIQHYPIINSKLNVLIGEESKRTFDYSVVVTNPQAISDKEEDKKKELYSRLEAIIMSSQKDEETIQKEIEELQEYLTYTWKDIREVRANYLLSLYKRIRYT